MFFIHNLQIHPKAPTFWLFCRVRIEYFQAALQLVGNIKFSGRIFQEFFDSYFQYSKYYCPINLCNLPSIKKLNLGKPMNNTKTIKTP